MNNIKFFLLILLLKLHLGAFAQKSIQNSSTTISFNNISLQDAIQKVNKLPNINLSYNPAIIPNRLINNSYVQNSVQSILSEILGEGFELKTIGSHIIIQASSKKSSPKTTFKISGGIKDAETGETLNDVTIYEINSLSSTLSDSTGDFELSVSAKTDYLTFAISRKNYQDTIIRVTQVEQLDQPVVLTPRKEKVSQLKSNIQFESKRIVQLFTSDKNRKNTENVQNISSKYFQLSLVPALGTNMTMGGQVKHELSINLLSGYSYALDGLEIGGLYNIDRHHMTGCQIGGLGNTVGGKVTGLQVGGIINTNKGYTKGAQIGGIINIVTDGFEGLQIAGIINSNKGYTNGLQVGGLINTVSDSVKGVQIAGITNISQSMDGTQISGLSSFSNGSIDGLQVSGFNSHAKTIHGLQLSGFMNFAREVNGTQIAGFINVSKTLKGTQFSIINYADSVSKGIPIGLISFVNKNGYFEPALENDSKFVRTSLRTGLKKFYNVLSVGIQIDEEELWSYGFGFGSQINIKNNFFTSLELRSHYLSKRESDTKDFFNLLNRFQVNIGYQLFDHLSITAGPVINIYLANETSSGSGEYGYNIGDHTLYEKMNGNTLTKIWLGHNLTIRF